MSYELRSVLIWDVCFGKEQGVCNGVLTTDPEVLSQLVLGDRRVASVRFDLAKPGESSRIFPVKAVIEPRAKPEGGTVFSTGPIVGFQEGLIDMSGPGAQYSTFSPFQIILP